MANLDVYLPQHAMCEVLPPQMRTKVIKDTKKHIKRMLQDREFVQDQESHAAREDKEAAGDMDLVVSQDVMTLQ